MRVILRNEIVGLGDEGEIVAVSDGYARNFLFPKKNAVEYNAQNLSVLKSQKKAIEKRRAERKSAYLSLQERIESTSITIRMKAGESGHLFGAVTSTVIVEELEKLDITLFKKQIVVPHHSIKEIGQYNIEIKLQAGILANLKLNVEAIEEEKKFDIHVKNSKANDTTEHQIETNSSNLAEHNSEDQHALPSRDTSDAVQASTEEDEDLPSVVASESSDE